VPPLVTSGQCEEPDGAALVLLVAGDISQLFYECLAVVPVYRFDREVKMVFVILIECWVGAHDLPILSLRDWVLPYPETWCFVVGFWNPYEFHGDAIAQVDGRLDIDPFCSS
jgi:hypothetical protein